MWHERRPWGGVRSRSRSAPHSWISARPPPPKVHPVTSRRTAPPRWRDGRLAVSSSCLPNLTKIRVVVVDDSAFIRQVIRNALMAEPDMDVVGWARDGLEALEEVVRLQPDVITLDC